MHHLPRCLDIPSSFAEDITCAFKSDGARQVPYTIRKISKWNLTGFLINWNDISHLQSIVNSVNSVNSYSLLLTGGVWESSILDVRASDDAPRELLVSHSH